MPGGARVRWELVAVVVAHLLLATAYNVAVPVFEAPDEPQHFFVAQHVARARALPVQALEEEARGPWEQEGSQPPLYYLLAAPLVALQGPDLAPGDLRYNHQNTMGHPAIRGNENRFVHPPEREAWPWRGYALGVHLARGLSTLMGAGTVISIWLVGRRVFPSRSGSDSGRWLPLAAAALVAFNPQFLATAAAVTNDVTIVLLATMALVLLLRLADGETDTPTLALLAVVVGLAPLAKLSGLALVAFALATVAGLAWRTGDRRLLVRGCGWILLSALVLSGWWYARNAHLYGDVTGLSHMLPQSLRRDFHPERWLRGLPGELAGLWYSSWGIFGWFTVMMPAWAYALITGAAAAALAGLVLAARRRAAWVSWPRLLWLTAWAAIVFASLLRWTAYAKGAHGRLLFPAIAWLTVGLVAGWRGLAGGRPADRALAAAVAAIGAAGAAATLVLVIRPAYAWPAPAARDAIPATARPAHVVFDDRVELVAADVPERATEGDTVPVTLYWAPRGSVNRDGLVALRLDQAHAGATEAAAGTPRLAHPGSGTAPFALWPTAWSARPDQVVVDRHRVEVPMLVGPERGATAPHAGRLPIAARLSVHVYDPSNASAWPASASGDPVADWSTSLVIEPTHPLSLADLPPLTLRARSEAGIDLYERSDAPPNGPVVRGEERVAEVVWLPRAAPSEDLTAFVHLVDAEGRLVATFDQAPATHGPLPTSQWRPDRPIPASLAWRPPTDAGAGPHRLLAGLYRSPDGGRAAMRRADGRPWPDDAVVLWSGDLR